MASILNSLAEFYQSALFAVQNPSRYYRNIYSQLKERTIIQHALVAIVVSMTLAFIKGLVSDSIAAAIFVPVLYAFGYAVGIGLGTLLVFGIVSMLLGSTRTLREAFLWVLWSMTLSAPLWILGQFAGFIPILSIAVSMIVMLVSTWVLFQGLEHYFGLSRTTSMIVASIPAATAVIVTISSYMAMMALKTSLDHASIELNRASRQYQTEISRAERELRVLEKSIVEAGEGVKQLERASPNQSYKVTTQSGGTRKQLTVLTSVASRDGKKILIIEFVSGKMKHRYVAKLKGARPSASEVRALIKLVQQKRPAYSRVAEVILNNRAGFKNQQTGESIRVVRLDSGNLAH